MSKLFKELNKQLDIPAEKHTFKWWHLPLAIILCVGTYFVVAGNHPREAAEEQQLAEPWSDDYTQACEGNVFGTIYHIKYQYPTSLQSGIDSTLEAVDNSLSPFNPNSVISAVNKGQNIIVDSMFIDVFTLAQQVSENTDGAFDITVAPLVNAWGFGFKNMENVSDKTITKILKSVGYKTLSLTKDKRVKKQNPETMIDCSAIAKGFGVDAVGKYLESQGVTSYMVEIGGEIRTHGANAQGQLWRIGITKPVDDSLCLQNDIQEVIKITNMSMATSGNYRNFYIKDGKKYAHTIDPRTGYPVQHNILSSTVLSTDCAVADAYATSFMVLGLKETKKILKKHPELMAYIIYSDKDGKNNYWCTESMKALIQK